MSTVRRASALPAFRASHVDPLVDATSDVSTVRRASALPAFRASHVDPLVTLRDE